MTMPKVGIAAGMIKSYLHIPSELLDTVSHITVGSYTLRPRTGNPEPSSWIAPDEQQMLNAIGLKNVGLPEFLQTELEPLAQLFDGRLATLRVSLAPTEPGELQQMIDLLEAADAPLYFDELEINAACPNHMTDAGIEPVLAHDMKAVESLMQEADDYLGGKALKIAPNTNYEKLEQLVELCDAYDFDTIVSANTLKHTATINGVQVLSVESGGLSGIVLTEHTIKQTYQLKNIIRQTGSRLKVIGCGGIIDGQIAHQLLHGLAVDEVQVATLYWIHGAKAVQKLVQEAAQLAD